MSSHCLLHQQHNFLKIKMENKKGSRIIRAGAKPPGVKRDLILRKQDLIGLISNILDHPVPNIDAPVLMPTRYVRPWVDESAQASSYESAYKTKEAPGNLWSGPIGANLWSGLVKAQQLTSTDENKTKLSRDPGHVTGGKKLAEHNRRVREEKKKKGGSKQSKDLQDPSCKGAGLQPEPSSLFSVKSLPLCPFGVRPKACPFKAYHSTAYPFGASCKSIVNGFIYFLF